jgi:hypothetical protein
MVDHLTRCRPDLSAIVAVDGGSSDAIVAELLAAGWTWGAPTELVLGKRIRTLIPPSKEN